MRWRVTSLSEDGARQIARWRYPAPYDCYDYPAWSVMRREHWAICDPARRARQFGALVGPDRDLTGYFRIRWLGARTAEIGLGLRPDLCGRGLGWALIRAAVDAARNPFAGATVQLRVRRFNRRAIRAYERAGFRQVADAEGMLTMVLDEGARGARRWAGPTPSDAVAATPPPARP